jgi:hypothetical protein
VAQRAGKSDAEGMSRAVRKRKRTWCEAVRGGDGGETWEGSIPMWTMVRKLKDLVRG